MKVTAPDSREYVVRRRVWPWRRKVRTPEGMDLPSFDFGDLDEFGILGTILLVIGLILAVPVIVVLVIMLSEMLLLLLLLPLVWIGRVAFRRPWPVDVSLDGTVVHREKVVGWRASGARARVLALALAKGSHLGQAR
ncbi:hypothetical protein CLV28_1170 [Sediminihabitans luteus]|uniref:Uncharacterized protein n=1 Tax=Sediminihabitans luteus TaxID=1138585 RepID=A0A2M9D1J7_9CELL|nr:hypothetical protein [Sediminihabitans luteus]PJJ77943.1 hypothetical protein CLV28_1170 [Sediminihabitans luteus]GII99699.1 hypothetical protein Slu03_20770 [Sediminihabitans luteus]